jgi:hypothetical protein
VSSFRQYVRCRSNQLQLAVAVAGQSFHELNICLDELYRQIGHPDQASAAAEGRHTVAIDGCLHVAIKALWQDEAPVP